VKDERDYRERGSSATNVHRGVDSQRKTPGKIEPEVLCEYRTKSDVSRLELRFFEPEDGSAPKPYLWLERRKFDGSSKGVSIRVHEIRGYAAALTRVGVRFASERNERRSQRKDSSQRGER
jgi:hypothetical protein